MVRVASCVGITTGVFDGCGVLSTGLVPVGVAVSVGVTVSMAGRVDVAVDSAVGVCEAVGVAGSGVFDATPVAVISATRPAIGVGPRQALSRSSAQTASQAAYKN